MAFDRVLAILKRDAGTHFDPDCVNSFFNLPLYQICRILLMDQNAENGEDNPLILLDRLDKHMTLHEYYACLGKEMKSKGESDIHRIFSRLYHQVPSTFID
jgi:hypothetical protein